ncbi:MAG: hypothetical protein ACYC35_03960 [Pirellulales bacterium]
MAIVFAPFLANAVQQSQGGFFMRRVTTNGYGINREFRRLVDAFLAQDGLPFANILSVERFQRVFCEHASFFGVDQIYSTEAVLWAFLGQVLGAEKEASCQAAVAAIAARRLLEGLEPPTSDTGDYCRARGKLSETALLREMLGGFAAGDIMVVDRFSAPS